MTISHNEANYFLMMFHLYLGFCCTFIAIDKIINREYFTFWMMFYPLIAANSVMCSLTYFYLIDFTKLVHV